MHEITGWAPGTERQWGYYTGALFDTYWSTSNDVWVSCGSADLIDIIDNFQPNVNGAILTACPPGNGVLVGGTSGEFHYSDQLDSNILPAFRTRTPLPPFGSIPPTSTSLPRSRALQRLNQCRLAPEIPKFEPSQAVSVCDGVSFQADIQATTLAPPPWS